MIHSASTTMVFDHNKHANFGTLLGTTDGGVGVYSSHYPSADKSLYEDRRAFRSYVDGIFMGYKWQCVELARRWLYVNRGYVFEDVAMAYDIFELRHVRRLSDGSFLPLRSFTNGSRRHPEPGCLLIWNEGGEFQTTGHVAVVTEVHADRICFVEQNVEDQVWSGQQAYSRCFNVQIDANGGYHIESGPGEFLLGWVIQTDDDTHAHPPRVINLQLFNLVPRTAPRLPPAHWIPAGEPLADAYLASMGGPWLTSVVEDRRRYFHLSETAEKEIRRATNELHSMFLIATDFVMQDRTRLQKFNIPESIWPKIEDSWNNRRSQMITGRFDFTISEHGLKVYEYNADSASCYFECGELQGRWAEAAGVTEGWDPGGDLHTHLVDAWKRAGISGTLHIMQDVELEETYHALYMKEAIEAAGINCKILVGLDGIHWDKDGAIVDADGERIRWVWKTWAWETALDQLRQESESTGQPASPRLMDVLLRKDVLVFEPLWTIIPSNKAILPVLWELFPNHPYLLDSQYELNEQMAKEVHVVKPIAGRCGFNISIVDSKKQVMNETGGQFQHQDRIYQQFFPLPRFDRHNIQLCTFAVDGIYSGACLRADTSLVITTHSDLLPLRVVEDADIVKEYKEQDST